ncbi:MAG: hypothetical protein QXG39_10395 [Candidatus Aenigmatarchaeota archaeon]
MKDELQDEYKKRFLNAVEKLRKFDYPFLTDVIKRTRRFFQKRENANNLEFGLNFLLELYSFLNYIDDVYSIVLRGSYGRLKPFSGDDLDYVILCRSTKFGRCIYKNERIVTPKLESIVLNIRKKLEEKFPFSEELEISLFLPTVPLDPRKRFELFLNEPGELEMRTYDSSFPNKNKNNYKYLKYVVYNTEICMQYKERIRSLKIVEKVRLEDYKKFDVLEEDARGISIIFDARIAGFIASKEKIVQPKDTYLKNELIKEIFPEIWDKLKEVV